MNKIKIRCAWASADPLSLQYHDAEWGKPTFDDKTLFEFLILEGMQAGLSWITILKKRENFRKAFDHFDAKKIAVYGSAKQKELLQNAGIIRNRLKIAAAITNAEAFLEVSHRLGSFSQYVWDFVDGVPMQNHWRNRKEVPPKTPLSDKMSKALKADGFKFVGSTICYAFMQAVGMVNDHVVDCFRHKELEKPHLKRKKI